MDIENPCETATISITDYAEPFTTEFQVPSAGIFTKSFTIVPSLATCEVVMTASPSSEYFAAILGNNLLTLTIDKAKLPMG